MPKSCVLGLIGSTVSSENKSPSVEKLDTELVANSPFRDHSSQLEQETAMDIPYCARSKRTQIIAGQPFRVAFSKILSSIGLGSSENLLFFLISLQFSWYVWLGVFWLVMFTESKKIQGLSCT